MAVLDCMVGEAFRIGRDIDVHLTGRVDTTLYVFIDAATRHELGGVGGFHASAPSGIRRCAHVLALGDGDAFLVGPVAIAVEAVRLQIPGARALREVRLHITAPAPLTLVRRPLARPRHAVRRWIRGGSCWS